VYPTVPEGHIASFPIGDLLISTPTWFGDSMEAPNWDGSVFSVVVCASAWPVETVSGGEVMLASGS